VKRVLGGILVGLGAFLLAAGLVAYFWAPDLLLKTPEAVDNTTYLTGEATKLNLSTGKQDDLPIKVTSVTLTDTKRSTDTVNAWVNNVCVVVDEGNPPDCIDKKDDRLVQASTDIFATDRVTGESVDDPAAYLSGLDYTATTGLVNKFPFGTEKKDYMFWDPTLGAAVPVTYEGTVDMDGLEVYEFHMVIDGATIEIAEGVEGTYDFEKTMMIEPTTGAIVDQSQHDVRTLEDGTNALDMQIQFTDDIVAQGVSDAKENLSGIKLVTQTVPLVGVIGGPLLIIAGVFLLVRSRRKPEPADGAPAPKTPATV
jgi:Porin PorA